MDGREDGSTERNCIANNNDSSPVVEADVESLDSRLDDLASGLSDRISIVQELSDQSVASKRTEHERTSRASRRSERLRMRVSPSNVASASDQSDIFDANEDRSCRKCITQSNMRAVGISYTESPLRSGLGGRIIRHAGGFEPFHSTIASVIASHHAARCMVDTSNHLEQRAPTFTGEIQTHGQVRKRRNLPNRAGRSMQTTTKLARTQLVTDPTASRSAAKRVLKRDTGGDIEGASSRGMKRITPSLPKPDIIPQCRDSDVLFGRSKHNRDHPGNKYMQLLADIHRAVYDKADRDDKTEISRNIVRIIKSQGNRFLKFEKTQNLWVEVSDEMARRKVGHALRDGRTRPLEPIDPTIVEELPMISDDIRKAVAQMSSLNQQDAQNNFGAEEADILMKLLSPPNGERPKAAEDDERKPQAKKNPTDSSSSS